MIQRATAIFAITLATSTLLVPAKAIADAYPMLEQLNRETQSLYRDVQASLVRVQLPTPKWIRQAAANEDPLAKWDKVIDPQVKARIDQQRQEVAARGIPRRIEPKIFAPTTQPGAAAHSLDIKNDSWRVIKNESSGEIVLEPRGDGSPLVLHAGGEAPGNRNIGGPLQLRAIADGSFAPNNIGLLISAEGHILVPLFIERETIGAAGIPVMIGDRKATATFIGSDEKTNVTLLKMEKGIGKPARIGFGRPLEGSLVMLLNPNSGSGRVQLWTGGERDFGVVVGMDGSVVGFARYGQFLGAAAAKPVIDQLIAAGKVQRAVLGVRLTEIRADERGRARIAGGKDHPSLFVDEVTLASPADKAGLRAGDLILEVEEQPVGDLTTWSALLARGGKIRLQVLRDGKPQHLTIDLPGAQ
jgi:PDZ domain